MTFTTEEKTRAYSMLRCINRHIRRHKIFEGGRTFGVDWRTWHACYPHLASVFDKHAAIVAGRCVQALPSALFGHDHRTWNAQP